MSGRIPSRPWAVVADPHVQSLLPVVELDVDARTRGMTEANGVYTVVGSGEIGPKDPPDDVVQI